VFHLFLSQPGVELLDINGKKPETSTKNAFQEFRLCSKRETSQLNVSFRAPTQMALICFNIIVTTRNLLTCNCPCFVDIKIGTIYDLRNANENLFET